MSTLVVDIETVGTPWRELPGISRAALTKWIDASDHSEADKDRSRKAVQERLALSPFTGSIAALAVYDLDRKATTVYVVTETQPDRAAAEDTPRIKFRTEADLLLEFWEGARGYDVFVTFNGRAFTLPFLLFRSFAHSIRPSVDISRQRYVTKQHAPYHVDLLDEFSNYGGVPHRPSLALLCGAFSLPNPSVLGGEEVAAAFRAGDYTRVAEKAAGDAETIALLYERWFTYLAPHSFVSRVEGLSL